MREIQANDNLQALARIFEEAGARLYIVGGAVRNGILGYDVADTDICSTMHPDRVHELLDSKGIAWRDKGAAFGTVDITVDGDTYEYAAFRREEYPKGGFHRPENVEYSSSLEEDALRRDFTINAVYYDIIGKTFEDPLGGIADIERGIIRTTSKDPDLIMSNDALRILRMCRFAGELGFDIESGTLAAAQRHSDGLREISPERVRDELSKLLMCDTRYPLRRRLNDKETLFSAFENLFKCGGLEAILPEVTDGYGIKQRADYHAYDVMYHMIHSVAEAKPELIVRLAMLLHDIGKPICVKARGKMIGHEIVGAEMADGILKRLRFPNAVREKTTTLIRWHMYDLNGNARVRTLKKRFVELGKDIAYILPYIREADVHGSGIITGPVQSAEKWRDVLARMEQENAPFTENELNCTGNDICDWLNIEPSRRVGEIKHALLLHCACKGSDNTPEKLKLLARDMIRKG